MTRVKKLDPSEWDEDLRKLTGADEASPLEQGLMRMFAHRPELAKGLTGFAAALKIHRSLPDRLVELVRLRVAYHNQCKSCMAIRYSDAIADGLTEDLVCSLEKPMEADNFTQREQLAIRYGELMASNHLAIDDTMHDELRMHFTEPEIVELGMTVAFFVGFGRLAATWNMIEELPEKFQELNAGILTPWGEESIIVR